MSALSGAVNHALSGVIGIVLTIGLTYLIVRSAVSGVMRRLPWGKIALVVIVLMLLGVPGQWFWNVAVSLTRVAVVGLQHFIVAVVKGPVTANAAAFRDSLALPAITGAARDTLGALDAAGLLDTLSGR